MSEILTWVVNKHHKGNINVTWVVTTGGCTPELIGVPARIREVDDDTGEYVLDFLDGSSERVNPDWIKILD